MVGDNRGRPISDPCLILCLCFIVYANSLSVGWISDDHHFILNNSFIKSLANVKLFFTHPRATGYEGIYRPLRTLSFAIDYRVWGVVPFGYHLVNLVLHAITSWLVYFLCLRLQFMRGAAFGAALLFAVHPAHVEAVTWIASRADLLAAIFMLLSALLFIRSRIAGDGHWLVLPGSAVLFVLALLAKETAIVLPVIFIAYDLLFSQKQGISARNRFFQYAIFIGISATYFFIRSTVLQTVSQRELWGGSLTITAMTMAECFLIYLRLVILPRATNCLEYLVPLVTPPFTLGELAPLVFLCLLLMCLIPMLWHSRRCGFGMIWFLAALAPVSNIFPLSMLMAERFLYVPMAGVAVAFASILHVVVKDGKRMQLVLFVIALCALVLGFGLITVTKNSAWKDPEVLYSQNLQAYPDSLRARMGLAGEYYKRGDHFEAIKQYEEALRAYPTLQTFNDLGNAYRQAGDMPSAISSYKAALQIDPDSARVLTNLGIAYLISGRTRKAMAQFRRALEIEPTNHLAHFYLGIAFQQQGQLVEALEEFRATLVYDPDRDEARRRIVEIEEEMR